nr:MAG TPA: hypothetical protein [Crassvirales sp.]
MLREEFSLVVVSHSSKSVHTIVWLLLIVENLEQYLD